MALFNDDDIFLVQRGGVSYRESGGNVASGLTNPLAVIRTVVPSSGVVTGDSVLALADYIGGVGPFTDQFNWYQSTIPVSGSSQSAVYTVTAADEGSFLQCLITTTDGKGTVVSGFTNQTNTIIKNASVDTPTLLAPPAGAGMSPSGTYPGPVTSTISGVVNSGILPSGTTTITFSDATNLDKVIPGPATMTNASGVVTSYSPLSSTITNVTLENIIPGSSINGVVDISAAFNDITEIRGLALQNLGGSGNGSLLSDMTVNGVSVRGGITAATVQGNSFLANRYNWSEPGTNGTPPGFWGQPYTGASGDNTPEAAQVGSTAVAGFEGFTYLSTLSSGDYITVPSGATITIRGEFYSSDQNRLLVLDQNDNWVTVVGEPNTFLEFTNNQDLRYFRKNDVVQAPAVKVISVDVGANKMVVDGGIWNPIERDWLAGVYDISPVNVPYGFDGTDAYTTGLITASDAGFAFTAIDNVTTIKFEPGNGNWNSTGAPDNLYAEDTDGVRYKANPLDQTSVTISIPNKSIVKLGGEHTPSFIMNLWAKVYANGSLLVDTGIGGDTEVTGPANTGTGTGANPIVASSKIDLTSSNFRWIESGAWDTATNSGNARGLDFYLKGPDITDNAPSANNLIMKCSAFSGKNTSFGLSNWFIAKDLAFANMVTGFPVSNAAFTYTLQASAGTRPVTTPMTNVVTPQIPAWNQSEVWSDYWGAAGSTGTIEKQTASFDGVTTGSNGTSNQNSFKEIVWQPTTPIKGTIRISAGCIGSLSSQVVFVNNAAVTILSGVTWYDIPGNELTNITLKDIGSSGGLLRAVEINGFILVDTGISGDPGSPNRTLSFATSNNFSRFAAGDLVSATPAGNTSQDWSSLSNPVSKASFDGDITSTTGPLIGQGYPDSEWVFDLSSNPLPGNEIDVNAIDVNMKISINSDAFQNVGANNTWHSFSTSDPTITKITLQPISGGVNATCSFKFKGYLLIDPGSTYNVGTATLVAAPSTSQAVNTSQDWSSGFDNATINIGLTFTQPTFNTNATGFSTNTTGIWNVPSGSLSYTDGAGGVEVYIGGSNSGYSTWAYKVNPAATTTTGGAPSDLSSYIVIGNLPDKGASGGWYKISSGDGALTHFGLYNTSTSDFIYLNGLRVNGRSLVDFDIWNQSQAWDSLVTPPDGGFASPLPFLFDGDKSTVGSSFYDNGTTNPITMTLTTANFTAADGPYDVELRLVSSACAVTIDGDSGSTGNLDGSITDTAYRHWTGLTSIPSIIWSNNGVTARLGGNYIQVNGKLLVNPIYNMTVTPVTGTWDTTLIGNTITGPVNTGDFTPTTSNVESVSPDPIPSGGGTLTFANDNGFTNFNVNDTIESKNANQSQFWSDGGDGNLQGGSWKLAFNGVVAPQLTTATGAYSAAGSTVANLTFDPPISGNIRVWASSGAPSGGVCDITLSDGSVVNITGGTDGAAWYSFGSKTNITSMTLGAPTNPSGTVLGAVELDGKLLVDKDVSYTGPTATLTAKDDSAKTFTITPAVGDWSTTSVKGSPVAGPTQTAKSPLDNDTVYYAKVNQTATNGLVSADSPTNTFKTAASGTKTSSTYFYDSNVDDVVQGTTIISRYGLPPEENKAAGIFNLTEQPTLPPLGVHRLGNDQFRPVVSYEDKYIRVANVGYSMARAKERAGL